MSYGFDVTRRQQSPPEQADTVLVVGEALIDIVETRTGEVIEAPGGSPLNVAISLGRLGIDTVLLTALGTDERADRIQDHVEASGVVLLDGAQSLPRTSTAAARMQPDGSARYEFDVAWCPPVTEIPPVRALHAGSLALFVEPGASRVQQLVDEVPRSTLVSLDPNVRPSLLPGHPAVVARFEDLLTRAHVVKLSDEDAAWLYPDLNEQAVLRHLLDGGVTLAVLTRGANGCILGSGATQVQVEAISTEVVDTIGAGDSFMGALIHQLLVRDLVDDLVSWQPLWPEELEAIGSAAAAAAAITVSRLGADPPHLVELGRAHSKLAETESLQP